MNLKTLLCALLTLLSCLSYGQNIQVFTLTPEFPGSGGVKLGPDGKLYIANFGDALSNSNGTQIWRMDTLDSFSTPQLWVSTGLAGASGNDFDSQGNLFQSNISGNRISRVSPSGTVNTFTSTGIVGPVGIAIGTDDTLFVCNCGNGTIQKVSPAIQSTLFVNSTLLQCPNGATMDHHGNLYVSNFNNGAILKITRDGTISNFALIPGSNNGHLAYYAPDSIFYVASHGSSNIYRLSMAGEVIKVAGTSVRGNQDGPGDSATFSRPNGIALSVTGDTLWVNSSIPTMDIAGYRPLNPSVIRMVTGLKSLPTSIPPPAPGYGDQVELSHYPNPAHEQITVTIDLPTAQTLRLYLMDANGNLIQEASPIKYPKGKSTFSWSLEDLPAGLYLYEVISEKFTRGMRFIKE